MLTVWTIYRTPSETHRVTEWIITPGTDPTPKSTRYGYLGELRVQLAAEGLTCVQRAEGDDPSIVESWL